MRIALAGFLALRRQWWHLAAFAAAIVLSEVLIGTLKGSGLVLTAMLVAVAVAPAG